MTEALEIEALAVEVPRDIVRVHGPDALDFLQGQLSQDVGALTVGQSAWSFLLQPQGKVDAWLRVSRLADDAVGLDVDGGWGDLVTERLERFKLRTKAEFERLDWRCIAVRGASDGEATWRLDPAWPGVDGVDLLGPEPRSSHDGALADYEALRIECGVPAMGRELTERTIPAESGVVERSVSFTKGCYTGQELVARIDSRGGNVPRRLRGLVFEGDDVPEAGTAIAVAGAEVGVVTSAAWSPRLGSAVALAYVKRDVEPPAPASVGGAVARIETLPLLRSAS